jgi:hypothetical protein
MTGSRRAVLLGLAAAIAAAPAAAAGKQVDAKKVFPYLDAYLKLPAADRSRFRLAYYFRRDGKPLAAPVWLVDGAARSPIPLRADGFAERLPSLAQIDRAKVEVEVEEGAKLGVSMEMEPTLAPAAMLDARELAAAFAQCETGTKKALGILAMAAPKLKGMVFHGVPSGEVEFADGRRAPLPMVNGRPVFSPASTPPPRPCVSPGRRPGSRSARARASPRRPAMRQERPLTSGRRSVRLRALAGMCAFRLGAVERFPLRQIERLGPCRHPKSRCRQMRSGPTVVRVLRVCEGLGHSSVQAVRPDNASCAVCKSPSPHGAVAQSARSYSFGCLGRLRHRILENRCAHREPRANVVATRQGRQPGLAEGLRPPARRNSVARAVGRRDLGRYQPDPELRMSAPQP